ncbi:hypothetical protein KKJ25_13600 [Xenorhabdus bovienii]|uniref:hypothetical protein n=1 Tax=Xenorhabdus bovienii TaxID=40576 RepID=UPI00237CBF08|nr:hypothetical protein [Xenorhabdus bovienii]MDE1495942.1 hypothetical protein [Xenorhabdus bovienii]MDE9473974.1 hypothetical protein [Xenorhabdus bovienii]
MNISAYMDAVFITDNSHFERFQKLSVGVCTWVIVSMMPAIYVRSTEAWINRCVSS